MAVSNRKQTFKPIGTTTMAKATILSTCIVGKTSIVLDCIEHHNMPPIYAIADIINGKPTNINSGKDKALVVSTYNQRISDLLATL